MKLLFVHEVNYETKVIDDKKVPLQFINGAHFAVKASAYYNYLLHENKKYQSKRFNQEINLIKFL